MPTINEITLINYKSFRHLEKFPLHPLNVLIGKNGTGKSNFINFFRLLSNAADERLTSSIRSAGGLKELRWRGSDRSEVVSWKLRFKDLVAPSTSLIDFEVHLVNRGQNNFAVQSEQVIDGIPKRGYSDGYKFLRAYNGTIQFLPPKFDADLDDSQSEGSDGNDQKELNYDYDDQELAIAQIRDPIRYPLLSEIRLLLDDWTIFRGFGENALQNIYDSQSLDVVSPLRLDAEGRNLVSVLHALYNDRRYMEMQSELEEILTQAFPDFQRLALPLSASGRAELEWRNQYAAFPASHVSDGMLRFLGLATLLLLPDPPSLIAIDEPEIGLHPQLIPLLGGLLQSASQHTQIIVATHSPLLLNTLQPEDVVIVESRDGETHLERLDNDRLQRWLENYTLGGLWEMGKLEPQV